MLQAVLERITYINEETGYTIARVATGTGRRHTALTHRLQDPGTTRP